MSARRTVLLAIRQMTIVSLLAGTAAMTLLVSMQRRVIYPLGYGDRAMPAAPAGFAAVRYPASFGSRLVWRHEGRSDRPVLLFLHGNATGIASSAYVTRPFADAGWTIVVPEYPGYPGNAGRPSEEGLLRAARTGWHDAIRSRNPGDIVILGNSIGSGPAIALAAETRPRGLAIVSGIASLPQVVRQSFPFVPDFLVWDRYANASTMAGVGAPVLVVHGDADEVVATTQGEALARAARVRLVRTDGGHEIIGRRSVQELVLRHFDIR